MYELQQAPTEVTIIQQSIRQRREIPDIIANAPQLLPGLQLYWNAWMDLWTCRRESGSMIPWSEIQYWADSNTLPPLQVADLHTHIRALDLAFLAWKRDKDAREKSQQQ